MTSFSKPVGTGSWVDVDGFVCEMAASISCWGTDEKLSCGSGGTSCVLKMLMRINALLLSGANGRGRSELRSAVPLWKTGVEQSQGGQLQHAV